MMRYEPLDLKRVAQIGHKGEREGISGRHSSPAAEAMAGDGNLAGVEQSHVTVGN
jgi:hypothetical protein